MIFPRQLPGLALTVSVLVSSSVVWAADPTRRLEPSYEDTARQLKEAREHVRVLEQRLRQLDARRAREAGVPAVAKPEARQCGLPFRLDEQGIKHLRAECAPAAPAASTAQASCSTPFALDETGIKRLRPECAGD